MIMVEPEYMKKKEWQTVRNERLVPSDIAPAFVIKEYNDIFQDYVLRYGEDVTIWPEDFVEMRKRAGYDQETINKELQEIYSKEELMAYL